MEGAERAVFDIFVMRNKIFVWTSEETDDEPSISMWQYVLSKKVKSAKISRFDAQFVSIDVMEKRDTATLTQSIEMFICFQGTFKGSLFYTYSHRYSSSQTPAEHD